MKRPGILFVMVLFLCSDKDTFFIAAMRATKGKTVNAPEAMVTSSRFCFSLNPRMQWRTQTLHPLLIDCWSQFTRGVKQDSRDLRTQQT